MRVDVEFVCVCGFQFYLLQCSDGFLGFQFLLGVKKHWLKSLGEMSLLDTRTPEQLVSHLLGPDSHRSREVKTGREEFSRVIRNRLYNRNCI